MWSGPLQKAAPIVHHANHFYGHANILARYAGLYGGEMEDWEDTPGPNPPRIEGYVQHGWNLWDGYAVGTELVPRFKKFVWSRAVARRGRTVGLKDYVVIGSPWAYLLKLKGIDPMCPPKPKGNSVILYPFHGWEGQKLQGSHEGLLEEVRAVEGDVPLTVCLYWDEYRDKSIRHAYEKMGVRVITHGTRGFMYKGGDHWFLDKQLAEVQQHSRAISNRMGSALLYAASLGLDIGVYGDPMTLEGDHAVLGGLEKQLRLFPEAHQAFVPRGYARQLANTELGTQELLTPDELRMLFGWKGIEHQTSEFAPMDDDSGLDSAPAQDLVAVLSGDD